MKKLLIFTLMAMSLSLMAKERTYNIWPSIPFIRGMDICQYENAYGTSRSEYLQTLVQQASDLMHAGARGVEALKLLVAFDSLYDKNLAMAVKFNYLDVTLESTLKAYFDQYYRNLRPKIKKLSFTNVNNLVHIIDAAKSGQRIGHLNNDQLEQLDFIAYGTYAFAPDCRGNILVTLHLIGRNGRSESFTATDKPSRVMSIIASEIFTQFQRTQFPTSISLGGNQLRLIGGANGSVDETRSPLLAQKICETKGARLPSRNELELLSGFGDWSGGVSLNAATWALPNNLAYVARFIDQPVRKLDEINTRKFYYYCVAD